MGFLIPSALSLITLALPIIIFYMLKLRRQPIRVSSLMLWQQVLEDRQANTPWQKLRRNLLLLLQLLILALLVMALARPFFTVEAQVQGNVVLLLDASASMQATDVSPSRFAAAKTAALNLINTLSANDAVTLIAVEHTPKVLAATTTDRNALRQALAAAQPSNAPADWDTALTLAVANAATLPDSTITIISDGNLGQNDDGRWTNDEQTTNPPSPHLLISPSPNLPISNLPISNLQFLPIGQNANNQGLTALSLRDGLDGPELFVRVFNARPEPVQRRMDITLNGQLFDARQLKIPGRDSASVTIDGLPPTTQQVQVSLAGNDDLVLDDTAWAVRNSAPTRLLLVGQGNLFLERALALLPDLQAQRATPDQDLPQSRFDLTILDRTVPETLPAGNLLFIAPPLATPLFEVSGVVSQTQLTRLAADHPLLNFVELNNLHVKQAQQISPPAWLQTIVEAKGGPLLLAGEIEGRRIAVLAFDLHQSDLPLQIDFPILMVNLIEWLSPRGQLEQGQSLQAGQAVNLPLSTSTEALLVRTPVGEEITLPANQTTVNITDLGLYQILAQEGEQNIPLQAFAVNLLSPGESDTQPRQLDTATNTNINPNSTLTGQREWWWVLASLALAVLLIEWWVYWRGGVR